MLSPVLFVEVGIFLENLTRGLALNILDNFGNGELGRHGNEEVHVLFGNVTFENLDIVRGAYFADEMPDAVTNSPREHGFFVFGGPDQVVLAIEYRMGGLAVEFHGNNLAHS
jgi:hypothetical protein